jgi:cytochrome c oxidase assembly factor CtaG
VTVLWPAEPTVIVPVVVSGALYLRGWTALTGRMPDRFGAGRAIAFMAGLAALIVALSAPMDGLADHFLQAHMVQHLILMVVAPPLIWIGAPVAPMLLGLPRPIRRAVAGGLACSAVRRLTRLLANPLLSWALFVVAFWTWHAPGLYELALRSDFWHPVEHACFLGTALLFWRPVILPWPFRSSWPRWAMIPYVVLADVQNNVLAAIFTFSDRVVYPTYAAFVHPRAGSALEDQAIAGVIMWLPGSLAFFLPVLWLVVTELTPAARGAAPRGGSAGGRPAGVGQGTVSDPA